MRIAVVVAGVLAVAAPARADRTMSTWLGVTFDGRATGPTFSDAGNSNDVTPYGGARLVLSFDNVPPVVPEPGAISSSGRLVPELLAGFYANDVRAEGFVGAGLRLELWLASHRRNFAMRTAMYAAARAIAIGAHQDGGAELVIGEYLLTGPRGVFGWEGGALIRARNDVAASEARELDALLTIFVGWR